MLAAATRNSAVSHSAKTVDAVSSSEPQGVPSFEYNPRDYSLHSLRFELDTPLDDLEARLLKHFAGRTGTLRGIYKSTAWESRTSRRTTGKP